MAAPIGAQIFGEVLPYLEVTKDAQTEENSNLELQIPSIEGKTIKEAETIIKENNLKLIINNEQEGMEKDSIIIKEQTPKAGIKVKEGSTIYIDW